MDLNYEKFNTTLTEILSGEDDLLKIRAILLMFMMKNCIDATTIFEILLTEDIINTNAETEEEEESLFNSDSRYFNNIFYNELENHPLLILDLVEIIKSFIKKNSLGYDAVYPIINKKNLANENSMTPVDSDKLIFMEESDVKEKHKEEIEKSYPIILPFKLKYEEYSEFDSTGTTVELDVNRDNVLDAVWLLDDLKDFNFSLKVHFGEDEIDAGGPSREFIDLAFKTIVLPETDLFELRNERYWFKYHRIMTEDLKKKYRSIGMLLGIAIINKLTIPIHFPRYFYKKLLHRDVYISDLNLFDPELFRSLTGLLENEINQDLDFSYSDAKSGYEIDLTNFSYVEDPINFEPAALNDQNKVEFISKIAEWVFDISVKESFAAFEEGYKKVNTNSMLYSSFMLDEIDKIVSGSTIIDWNALKERAKYKEGYTKDSQVIIWFWKYFDSLSDDKKFEVLKFIRGTTSVPAGGLKDVKIKFYKSDGVFPQAHTCFSSIDLPEYGSYEELERRCSEAFPNTYFGNE